MKPPKRRLHQRESKRVGIIEDKFLIARISFLTCPYRLEEVRGEGPPERVCARQRRVSARLPLPVLPRVPRSTEWLTAATPTMLLLRPQRLLRQAR